MVMLVEPKFLWFPSELDLKKSILISWSSSFEQSENISIWNSFQGLVELFTSDLYTGLYFPGAKNFQMIKNVPLYSDNLVLNVSTTLEFAVIFFSSAVILAIPLCALVELNIFALKV